MNNQMVNLRMCSLGWSEVEFYQRVDYLMLHFVPYWADLPRKIFIDGNVVPRLVSQRPSTSTIIDGDSFISLACLLCYSFYGFDFFVLLLGSAPIGGLNLFVADFSASGFLSWVLWVTSSTSLVSRRLSTLIVVTAIVGTGKNLFNCHGDLWSSEVKCCCSCWNISYSHWSEQKMAPGLLLHKVKPFSFFYLLRWK